MKLLFVVLAALASVCVQAKESPAPDCTYLLMSTVELRQSLHALMKTVPTTQAERESVASQLRIAANVLVAQTGYGDPDAKNAFQIARELVAGRSSINIHYPLTIDPNPVAQFKTTDLGPLKARFPRLKMVAYAVHRANDMNKPVAYITKMILDVHASDDDTFSSLFHRRAFLHESISAALNSHREDLLQIAASIVDLHSKKEHPGRYKAALISPVVTDSFAYAHADFRTLRREHQNFLQFFKEMQRSPDEIIFEIMHFLGLFTDQADFEN